MDVGLDQMSMQCVVGMNQLSMQCEYRAGPAENAMHDGAVPVEHSVCGAAGAAECGREGHPWWVPGE